MSRLTEGIRRANDRDREFILKLNLQLLDKVLLPLFAVFLCLNFLDVYSTMLALQSATAQDFRELNPIASTLFSMRFNGFVLALFFKYLPAIPLFYAVFVKDVYDRRPFEIRLVRFVALVVLAAADMNLGFVVAVNNIPILVAHATR